ncbi:MAG TPA: DnaJ domain-containing protein [Planctomycetota bacterium]|nr:DnaJ domain-containing protein [Planctomycetota bacterium]
MERDYYADLGVSRTATLEEINAAFRKLAARYHPDRNPGDKTAEQKFTRIAEAYNVLKDPKTREAYDRGGSEQVEADTGFRGFDSSEEVFSHFGDLFGDLFGNRRFRARAFRRWPEEYETEIEVYPEPAESLDLKREIHVDVFTALLGGKIDVPLFEGTAEMTVPPGTQPNQQFRLAGQGYRDRRGRRGDVLVTVRVEIPRRLTADQRRLLEQARAAR